MHALLDRFFTLALAEVHRYEGTINQFLGDGFMALFAHPLHMRIMRGAPCWPRPPSSVSCEMPPQMGDGSAGYACGWGSTPVRWLSAK
jgi:class 3 adenylate cyclase